MTMAGAVADRGVRSVASEAAFYHVTVEDGGVVTKPIADCPANEGFVSLDGSSCPVPATPSPSPTPAR